MKQYKIKNAVYIPYSFASSQNRTPYYDYRPVMSYGTKTVGVIGARQIGKTYGAKIIATRRFFKDGALCVWLRDNDEARKKLSQNDGAKFFSDYLPRFSAEWEGKIRGEEMTINGETFGYLQPTSTFQNYKGSNYENIRTIVFDEFIPEWGKAQRATRVWEFINSVFTILSHRKNARMFLLANALDRGDEILDLFGVKITDYGIYVNREKDVAIHYCDNHPDFLKKQQESIVGKIIKGTQYEENLLRNHFSDDENQFYIKRPPHCTLLAILHTNDAAIRLYIKDGTIYVSKDIDDTTNIGIRYVNDLTLVNTRRRLITRPFLDNLRKAYNANGIKFATGFSRNVFLEFCKKNR